MNTQRFELLDGLRGVAALMVLLYHVFNDAKSFFVWPTPVNEFMHSLLLTSSSFSRASLWVMPTIRSYTQIV